MQGGTLTWSWSKQDTDGEKTGKFQSCAKVDFLVLTMCHAMCNDNMTGK